jgi:hypothetical protein
MNVSDSVAGALRAWLVVAFGILCLAVPSGRMHAQPPSESEMESIAGRTFIVAFPDTVINEHDHNFVIHTWEDQIVIAIYSAVPNTMTITGPAGYSKRDVALQANQFTIVDFTKPEWRSAYPIAWEVGKITSTTFRVETQQPVIVYCMMLTEFGAEAWTPLPVEKWGKEYFAAARDGEVVYDVVKGGDGYEKAAKMAPSEIAMIAAYDNTQVTFNTNARMVEDYPRAVTLNAGQVYTVQTWVDLRPDAFGDQQPDFAGTRIIASKPIAVISGNTRAQVLTEGEGLTQNPWKNMLIEWIPPVEQHGTEFVFMPTWDQRRPVGDYLEYKRQAEFVRLYATRPGQTEGTYTTGDIDGDVFIDPINQSSFTEFRFGSVPPRFFHTDKPAMAMMNSAATVRFNGLIKPGPPDIPDPKDPPIEPDTTADLSRDYEGWSAYMVEMVPREQWTSFAPFWAPAITSEMEHYINVVTDSANGGQIVMENGSAFIFNRGPIGTTGLIWGTMAVTPAVTHFLRSTNGGRFYAFGYGLLRGQEQYIYQPAPPPRPKEDGKFEHREYMAISYGYPLSPRRNVLSAPDTLDVQLSMGCTDLTVTAIAKNAAPAGIRVIKLEPAVNARIKTIDPVVYVSSPNATVVIEPIDKTQSASGTLQIIDRTGNVTSVPYSYVAEALTFNPAGMLDFGEQTMGIATRRDVTVTNPVDKTIEVKSLRLFKGNEDFTIVAGGAQSLAKGASMTVTIEAKPTRPGRLYIDSLIVETACTTASVALRMETVQPFLQINDVNFRDVTLFGTKDLPLYLCNVGRGTVTFHDSLGNDVITFGDNHFIVSDADKARLRAMQLGPDECDSIMVRFTATETGVFRTTARVIANTRQHRDTSVWTAIVRIPGPQIDAVEFGSRWLVSSQCSQNPLTAYEDSVEVFNTGSSDFDVVSLELLGTDVDAGFFVFDKTDPGSTILPNDRVRAVSGSDTTRRYQKILFKPTQERDNYTATLRMTVVNPVSGIQNTVENTVTGTGVLSHIALGNHTFDTVQFAAGSTVVPGTVTFEIKPARPTTITDVRFVPNTGEFVVTNLAALRKTWQPGEVGQVQLEFRPTTAGLRTAQLVIVGDQSSCDEPGGALIGFTRGDVPPTDTLGLAASNLDFGAIIGCHDSTGSIAMRNTGTVPVTITAMTLVDGGPEFSITPLAAPVTIAPGGSTTFNARFTPSSAAPATGHVRFDARFEGSSDIINRVVTLSGSGASLAATATIATDLRAVAGDALEVPITLSTAVNAAKVSDLTVTLRYDREMMFARTDDPASMVAGTILAGWTTQVVSHQKDAANPREMVLTLRATAPSGSFANGAGQLLKVPFRTLIGDTMRTALPFTISSASSPCVAFATTPGAASLDSICGMSFRLVDASATTYKLKQNAPNPFNPTTTIQFAVGLDARTTLTIYDASGRRVATLVDAFLQPGEYSVQWDASAQPSGLYYYRLNSSMWSRTNTMILQK